MNKHVTFSRIAALCMIGVALAGCSAQSTMSKDDEERFRHPVKLSPADQAKALADYQAATQRAIKERTAAGLPPPGTPPGGQAGMGAPGPGPAAPGN